MSQKEPPKTALVYHVRCYVRYTGRIDAELELGDRLIMILADGAAVLHAVEGGVKPKNWMPTGTTWSKPEPNILVGEHLGREEKLEIYIDKMYQEIHCDGTLHGKLVKLGSEYEVSNWIAQNPTMIEEGMSTVQREYRTNVGPIDILMNDYMGNKVIVEVKRIRVVNAEVIYQLLRYQHALISEGFSNIRCMLIAPALAGSAKKLLAEHSMEYRKLTYSPVKKTLTMPK